MKYALIGCGRIATNHMKAALNNDLEIVAVCDVIPEKMEELLKEEDLEIISNGIINRFDEISEELRNRCRIIPFSSVGKSNGMIIGIRPDYIKIYEEENIKIIKKVIVGIYDKKLSKSNQYSGLIGLELLNKESERIGDFNEHYTNNKV